VARLFRALSAVLLTGGVLFWFPPSAHATVRSFAGTCDTTITLSPAAGMMPVVNYGGSVLIKGPCSLLNISGSPTIDMSGMLFGPAVSCTQGVLEGMLQTTIAGFGFTVTVGVVNSGGVLALTGANTEFAMVGAGTPDQVNGCPSSWHAKLVVEDPTIEE
jgi:hypothetical protein